MKRMAHIAFWWGVITFLCQWVLWPIPMYGAYFVMSKGVCSYIVYRELVWLICLALHGLGRCSAHLAMGCTHYCQRLSAGRWRCEANLYGIDRS